MEPEIAEAEPVLTLEELEKKIEELIKLKLTKMSPKTTHFRDAGLEDDLQIELNELIEQVRSYQQSNEGDKEPTTTESTMDL
jgi:archaellum component FlaC